MELLTACDTGMKFLDTTTFAEAEIAMATVELPSKLPVVDAEIVAEKPIKYIHFRFHFDDEVSELNPLGTSACGGVTAAYQQSASNGSWRYALAYCNRADLFNKHIGRTIAANRMLNNQTCWFVSGPMEKKELIDKYIKRRMFEKMEDKYDWSKTDLATTIY